MKKYIELTVISLNLVAFAASIARSFATNRIVEVTSNSSGNSDVDIDGEGRDLSRYEADHTIDEVLALLPADQFIKVTVKQKDEENAYTSGSEPVKLLNLSRILYFEANGADDTKILYYKNGFAVVSYIINETYAAIKTAVQALPFISGPSALVATGTVTGDALEVTGAFNQFGTVAAGTGARIQTAATKGSEYIVVNDGANALKIYPPTGYNFVGLAANVAISLAAGKKAMVVIDPTTATLCHYFLFA